MFGYDTSELKVYVCTGLLFRSVLLFPRVLLGVVFLFRLCLSLIPRLLFFSGVIRYDSNDSYLNFADAKDGGFLEL